MRWSAASDIKGTHSCESRNPSLGCVVPAVWFDRLTMSGAYGSPPHPPPPLDDRVRGHDDDGGAVVDTGRRIVRGGRPLLPVSTRTSFAGVVTVERGLGY